jgi:sulfate/thiosulfate transport system substrate-binding protein
LTIKRAYYFILCLLLLSILVCCRSVGQVNSTKLLHVSFDPTRELFEEYNQLFAIRWEKQHSEKISVVQSHGGSGKQARAIIAGLHADVVSLALAFDIDQINLKSGFIGSDWQKRFPNLSSPFYSTIVFLVRSNNPRQIRDWEDLSQSNLEIITPNPKTSGGARWNYLAAWAYAIKKNNNDHKKAVEFMKEIFRRVPVSDSGARAAATSFVEREIGDVLLTWESDAHLVLSTDRGKGYEIIYPSLSIKAEPVVSVVDSVVDKRGTQLVANEYINHMYSNEAQQIISKHKFRSIDINIQNASKLPSIELVGIDQLGGWSDIQEKHFSDNGIYDQIMEQL